MKNEEGIARRPEGESQFATAGEWYTLDGRKLSGKPAKAGLYIYNSKKVVIKWEKWELAHISKRERARTKFKVVIKWE